MMGLTEAWGTVCKHHTGPALSVPEFLQHERKQITCLSKLLTFGVHERPHMTPVTKKCQGIPVKK